MTRCPKCWKKLQSDFKLCPYCGRRVTVVFADKNLEATVRQQLERTPSWTNPEHPLNRTVMRKLTSLNASSGKVKYLNGLDSAVKLTDLYLAYNQISDVGPLASLSNLNELGLGANQINDVSPLESLTHLTTLDLQDNQISDVSPLASLTYLRELRLGKNEISDISPLASLTSLEELDLQNNPVKTGLFGRDVHVKTLMSRGVKVKG